MVKTVILALAAAPVSAEKLKTSRKVPPRHPLNRIARLQQFGFAYVDKYYPPVNGGNKGQGKNLIEAFTSRMQSSFNRAQLVTIILNKNHTVDQIPIQKFDSGVKRTELEIQLMEENVEKQTNGCLIHATVN